MTRLKRLSCATALCRIRIVVSLYRVGRGDTCKKNARDFSPRALYAAKKNIYRYKFTRCATIVKINVTRNSFIYSKFQIILKCNMKNGGVY